MVRSRARQTADIGTERELAQNTWVDTWVSRRGEWFESAKHTTAGGAHRRSAARPSRAPVDAEVVQLLDARARGPRSGGSDQRQRQEPVPKLNLGILYCRWR